MRRVTTRLLVPLSLAALFLGFGSAGSSAPLPSAGGQARAFGIQVLVPGAGSGTPTVSAPPNASNATGNFSYSGEAGGAVATGAVSASASATSGANATATATSQVSSLSLFGGEITAASVTGRVTASTRGQTASGDVAGSGVSGLTVLGQGVSAGPNGRVALGDWGYAIVLAQSSAPATANGAQTYRAFVTGLAIHLTAPHGGLPAGTEIQVGYAEASVQASSPPKRTPTVPERRPGPTAKAAPRPSADPSESRSLVPPVRRPPSGVSVRLTAGGYVFPVYGPCSFSNTFGTPRAGVGWHHGEDIFAPLGAPVLAVASGTVFSVGWNDIGGNRLWLRDGQGNEFYYAHLSAFSPLARNGKRVRAGEVLGFVGSTGDAEGTPYHLHFEIHPVSYLYMGYDGVVPPYPFLMAWRKLQDVRFNAAAGWVGFATSSPAPSPGAVLLHVSDISEASGLDPASLRRAFEAPVSSEGDGALIRAARLGAPSG